jgi:hypothetical protein
LNVIAKAKTACEVSGNVVSDHFADVSKMVGIGSWGDSETHAHSTSTPAKNVGVSDLSQIPMPHAPFSVAARTECIAALKQRIDNLK